MPYLAVAKNETDVIQTHVSVVHATKPQSYALDRFCRALSDGQENIAWIRTSPICQIGGAKKNMTFDYIKDSAGQTVGGDNTDRRAWHLLSCCPSFWQNTNIASEESTADYFFSKMGVIDHDFSKLINQALDYHKLMTNDQNGRQALVKRFSEITSHPDYNERGVIYQYLIPHELVDEVAYISKQNGVPDPDNPKALDTLKRLKTPGETVVNQDTLQVRLYVPKLLDPNFSKQITVVNHFGMDDKLRQEFDESIVALAKSARQAASEDSHKIISLLLEASSPVASPVVSDTPPQMRLSYQAIHLKMKEVQVKIQQMNRRLKQ